MLKQGYVRADSDGFYYHIEDTEWGIWPDGYDPGYLVPKAGAISVSDNEALEEV